MTASQTAYTARWVLPISRAPIEHGVVVVDGRRISFVGTADAVGSLENVRVVSLGDCALLPGLVNAHTHLELTALRGCLEGLAFRDWLVTLTAARRDVLHADALLDSARQGAREALRNGVTTCADTSDSGAPLQAMRDAGLRGIGYIEVFGPDFRQCESSMATLRDRVDVFRASDSDFVRTGISPHAPYTVSAALFGAVARYALSEKLSVAVHVAESVAETQFVRDGAGPFADGLKARGIGVAPQARSPIALLESSGVLATQPLLIHAIHLDDADIAVIAANGATVAHCPISNAKLGHGIAPLERMLDAGIAVGLGTDSVASNDRMDLLGEARQAALLAALHAGAPDALPAHAALQLATVGSARALGLDGRIGTLEAGKDADLAAFALDGPDAQPVYDPAVTLVHVLAGTMRASLVTVAGRELVRDGVVLKDDANLDSRMTLLGQRLREWRHARASHGWRIG